MSRLYELTRFRNKLISISDDLSTTEDMQFKIDKLDRIKKTNPSVGQTAPIDRIINRYYDIINYQTQIISEIATVTAGINTELDQLADELINTDDYKTTFTEDRIFQELPIDDDIEKVVNTRIAMYNNWHYPGLEINPRSKKWIDIMVAADPLYLIHFNEIFQDACEEYPMLFQNKLRRYTIIDRDFSTLPQGQFGFILCWDNFNYLSLDKIEHYLSEVFNLLRPGGVFMFSFSDAEFDTSAYRAEFQVSAYCSSRWLAETFIKLGYEFITFFNMETKDAFNTPISWAEVRKPGELTYIKAHPALAEIKYK